MSPFRTLLHQKFVPPSPISTREQYLESSSFVVPGDLGIFTSAETINDEVYFGQRLEREKGSVEMKYTDSATYLKPVGPGKVSF